MASFPDKYNLRKDHPAVQEYPYEKTSERDSDYNCFAYVAGDMDTKWCPHVIPIPGYFWPVKRADLDEHRLSDYIEGYATIGFIPCDNGELEDGYEKIALFADENGHAQHAAIQREDGSWQSKIGMYIDIRHSLATLESSEKYGKSIYGKVARFLKRRRPK